MRSVLHPSPPFGTRFVSTVQGFTEPRYLTPTDDSLPSDHDPADERSRPDLSVHRQAVLGSEGVEVETTLTDHGTEVGRQRSSRPGVPTSGSFVDDRPQTSAGSVDAGERESLFASSTPTDGHSTVATHRRSRCSVTDPTVDHPILRRSECR